MTKGGKKGAGTGLRALKTLVSIRGLAAIDQRTLAGRAMMQFKSDLLRDLGGEANISAQKHALVDSVVRSKLYLDCLDAWLLRQASLVNARRKSIIPALRERQIIADGLLRTLTTLGLDRVAKDAGTLPPEWIEKVQPPADDQPERPEPEGSQ